MWLIQRPHLRGLPYPWPGTETKGQYLQQIGKLEEDVPALTAKVLAEIIGMRYKVGARGAFMEDGDPARAHDHELQAGPDVTSGSERTLRTVPEPSTSGHGVEYNPNVFEMLDLVKGSLETSTAWRRSRSP